jgi:hypothetical protein
MHPHDPVGDIVSNIKIKVAQNIFMNKFSIYSFLIFSFVTELNALSNLFWITPRGISN